MKSPVLYESDCNKNFNAYSDASESDACIVLSQIREGKEHPTLYVSKKFPRSVQLKGDLQPLFKGKKKVNHYPNNQNFKIQTNHKPLIFLIKLLARIHI